MKSTKRSAKLNTSRVRIDKSLAKYKGKVIFQEKLDKANEALKNTELPIANKGRN